MAQENIDVKITTRGNYSRVLEVVTKPILLEIREIGVQNPVVYRVGSMYAVVPVFNYKGTPYEKRPITKIEDKEDEFLVYSTVHLLARVPSKGFIRIYEQVESEKIQIREQDIIKTEPVKINESFADPDPIPYAGLILLVIFVVIIIALIITSKIYE